MTKDELHAAALALPAASFDVKWGDHHVYSVGGRMFCMTNALGESLSFKATDIAFEVLTETGRARPAPYSARHGWVRFDDLDALDAAEVADWIATAHRIVAGKLPRKQRAALGVG